MRLKGQEGTVKRLREEEARRMNANLEVEGKVISC